MQCFPSLPLLLSLLATACAFPLSCTAGTYLGCYNDTVRPVGDFLVAATSHSLTRDSCSLMCAADGFALAAATSNPTAAYCYCGSALRPQSTRVADALCALPCPGNASQTCGGVGVSAAWRSACDSPLPQQAVGLLGPPLPSPACSSPASQGWAFCNTSLGREARLDDLMTRIAVTEYGGQLTARVIAPIPRLGMAPFMAGTNVLHGITDYAGCRPNGRCPTTWPNGVSMGATWNRTAWRTMGAVSGTELRAYDNLEWRANAISGEGPVGGLTAWGPTVNCQRDMRWGRTQEAFTEDPFLNARVAVEISRGLQEGEDPDHMLAVATLKHAFAYSLEQWTDSLGNVFMRQTFNALVSAFDMGDTYTPQFKAAISEGRAGGVMYSANALNGVPLCVDAAADALLDSWVQPGQPFYRASDGGQVQNAVDGHHYAPNLDAAIGLAAQAETDIADGLEYSQRLLAALCNGNVTLAAAARLVRNTLRIRMALGLFDPAASQPYLTYGEAHIASAAANASVVMAAREGMVLLKNEGGTLPLRPLPPPAVPPAEGAPAAPPLASLAVLGPCADDMLLLGGNYLGAVCPNGPHGPASDCHPSILGALLLRAPDALYAAGGGFNNTSPPELAAAAAAAAGAARTVLCLGLDKSLEREQLDRTTTALPLAQQQLFSAVEGALAGTGRPLVVVLVHGGGLSIDAVAASPTAGAVLDALLPGCAAGGEAVAGALFGDFSPSGKMPYTVPFANWSALSNFTDMAIAPTPQSPLGRTYRYATQPPLFPFGYGLSYTEFELQWEGGQAGGGQEAPPLALSPTSPPQQLTVAVRNTGGVAAGEVVQLYFAPQAGTLSPAPPHTPTRQLWQFERTQVLAPGGGQVLAFNLTAQDLLLTSEAGVKGVVAGLFNVSVTRGHGLALWVMVNVTAE